jgi:poly(glycerol-phosphate) alpha-glucosyltransferase
VRLPEARYFAVTWGIADDYGGMTAAMLHRSRAFDSLAGTPVEILTFDTRPDYPDLERRLRTSGTLLAQSRITNLWDWFRENQLPPDAPGSLALDRHAFTPLNADPAYTSTLRGRTELTRTRFGADGHTVLQVDHYRLDGSLLLSDRRDANQDGILGGRSVVLCGPDGRPVRSWGRIWALYRYWLDRLRGGTPSIMLVDSKTTARFMLGYRRKKALTVHIIHGSHLVDVSVDAAASASDSALTHPAPSGGPANSLRPSRRSVIENLTGFDLAVVLTSRQKADITALLGPVPNLTVVPNAVASPTRRFRSAPRPLGAGIMIASLTPRKRVEHAIGAAIDATLRGASPITLDIFGDGPERKRLEGVITDRGASDFIHLQGHRRDAPERLHEASFLVLTSRSEGLPLVLVEAMAAGCVPIAYDIPYGPADIIDHGRNGFIVPAGDQDALVAAIVNLQQMPQHTVARLRRSARRSAAAFTDRAVLQMWGSALFRALAEKEAARRAGTDTTNSAASVVQAGP